MQVSRQQGFSLVELAIVIMVMGLILGGLMMPLSVQRENARIGEARSQLEQARSGLQGFALVNGFLPCPATPSSGGSSITSGGNCQVAHGFLPATTLGLDGKRNADNLLLDPWGSPLRYSVSTTDVNSDGQWDFTNPGQMSTVGISALAPNLNICSTAAGATATSCAAPNDTLTTNAPVVIISLGSDWSSFSSPDQVENVGANLGGGPSGTTYRVAGNRVFVSRGRTEASGGEFDDVILWLSANDLYRRLIDAGQLP